MNFKKQLQKDREGSFEVWYKRCMARANLKQEMRISAKKGHSSIQIDCLSGNENDIRRKKSVEFLEYLWRDFPDLDIQRESGSVPGFIRSQPYNRIVISWGKSE